MSVTIDELIYDPRQGRDVAHSIKMDYEPRAYRTKEEAAKGLYEALRKHAANIYGQSPGEVFIQTPDESAASGYGRNWRVCWEAGPFEWAIGASFQVTGPWGFTEPYYGFDLCFTD